MARIKNIVAREIKDSRGNPTVEVGLETAQGSFISSCPSGVSTEKNEDLEMFDEDGKGVSKAIENVNKIIAKELKGKDVLEQKILDNLMIKLDGTENKSNLGSNAILPVSMAICRAGSVSQKLPLYQYILQLTDQEPKASSQIPLAMFNFIEGGAHAVGRNNLDFQEFMVVPQKKSFKENLVLANKIFESLKKIITENYGESVAMGDEGGFAPKISKTEQVLLLLKNSIAPDEETVIAIDASASQFFNEGKYMLEGREFSRQEMIEFYRDLTERFRVNCIEDPFSEEDFEGFRKILKELPNTLIMGDDLTKTNAKRIKEAHSKNACNGVVIKLNQIGTVSEAIEAVSLAKSYDWKTVVSHGHGETRDTFIADFAVGVGADFIKFGSPAQEERMVKYNRLLEIENELKNN